jgi:hypothetical protein
MIETANHILSKEGILTTFSIAKRISVKDMQKLRQKIKSNKFDAIKFQNFIKKSIMEDTKQAILSKKIPGLIIPERNVSNKEKEIIMELTYFASIISKKINEKNIDKYYSCYIINAIVNMLGLTEGDFDEFHRKFSKYREGGDSTNDPVA